MNTLRKLQHPNIVQFVGFDTKSSGFGDEKQFFILTEWVPGGSIHSLLKKGIKLEENVVKAYTRQVIMGGSLMMMMLMMLIMLMLLLLLLLLRHHFVHFAGFVWSGVSALHGHHS
jgi:serine/threonine protein kinase